MPDGGLGAIVHGVNLGTETGPGAGRVIELAHRESGSTHIALLWSKEDSSLTVSVVGSSPDDSFELEVAEAVALDVFYHPYAYAALRRAASDSPEQEERPRARLLPHRPKGRR